MRSVCGLSYRYQCMSENNSHCFSKLKYHRCMQVNPDAGQNMYAYLYPYAHFVFNAAVCVSAWLVVSLAVERYLLVCWPTRTRALTSAARSVTPISRSLVSKSRSPASKPLTSLRYQGHDLGFDAFQVTDLNFTK